MTKTLDKIKDVGKKVALGLSVPLVLAGCSRDPNITIKQGVFRGFDVAVVKTSAERNIIMSDPKVPYWYISGHVSNLDGRFNEIGIYVSKWHDLDKYANPDSLELAYSTIMEQN